MAIPTEHKTVRPYLRQAGVKLRDCPRVAAFLYRQPWQAVEVAENRLTGGLHRAGGKTADRGNGKYYSPTVIGHIADVAQKVFQRQYLAETGQMAYFS